MLPNPGDTFESVETVKLRRSGRTYHRPATVPAWPVIQLAAILCPECHDLTLMHQVDGEWQPLPGVILCDGCDALCAAGATLDEARHTLTTVYGGWTAGTDADWDLCGACNPAATPTPPPRALNALTMSRQRRSPHGRHPRYRNRPGIPGKRRPRNPEGDPA